MEENKNIIGKFLDPEAIITQLEIFHGEIAVDFGCGSGYFSIPFARRVGEGGRVYALDIMPQALETTISKAKNVGILNIIAKRVNFEKEKGTKLEDKFADWVILKDVLFQNKDKEVIIAEACRILKNEGKVIVVEWSKNETGVGPAEELRIPQTSLEKIFSEKGFIVEKNIEAGDFHYAFIAVKSQ
jgi:ubiquinone/menaquinone biosynthesis C-methylase UbiE